MEYFDTHAHYDDAMFNEDREAILDKIQKMGVTRCVNVGCNEYSSKVSLDFADKYKFMYAICGIQPCEIPQTEEELLIEIDKIKSIIKNNKKVVAIGEIGLDYHYDGFNKDLQKIAFVKQIELANELNLPISIHTRDAIDDTINILRTNNIKNSGVIHCCPFNKELIKHGLEQGLYIAFGGTSTFKNSKNAKEILNMMPKDRIVTETDSPYLAPDPVRGTRNDSSNLRYIVRKIAELREEDEEEVAKYTYENAMRLFKLK